MTIAQQYLAQLSGLVQVDPGPTLAEGAEALGLPQEGHAHHLYGYVGPGPRATVERGVVRGAVLGGVRGGVRQAPQVPRVPLVPQVPGQLVMPAGIWNWPDPLIGTATDAQFRFADAVPQSAAAGALYWPSGRSFSQGYQAFLDFIEDARFPSPGLLAKARLKATPPTGDPATSPAPNGWTKVTVAGLLQWAPIWDLPQSAEAWLAAVVSGRIVNPGTVQLSLADARRDGVVDVPSLQAQDAGGRALTLPPVNFDTVAITAACWGQVPIYPGSWFDASMLALGRSHVPDASLFFGPAGLLACRVASFYVAWQPTFEFTSSAPIPSALKPALSSAQAVQALGMPVQASAASAQVIGASLRLVGAAPEPAIVAVLLEVLA